MNDYNVNVIISGPNNEHPATYKTFILRGNTSFADQVTEPNTKYVIKWDFNLNGETVTVPENCILEFDGGTLKNGTIIGQDTFYSDEGGLGDNVIFGNGIIKEGTWRKNEGGGSVEQIQSDWNQTDSEAKDFIKNKPNIPEGVIVDTALSKTSTNPVQNKVITEALENVGGNPDKPYDPTTHSGLGRKTLELKEDGSNVLTQEDFSDANTIYVVQYDFDLNGADIQIPEGCVLDFEGGSFINGSIKSNSTKLDGTYRNGLKNISRVRPFYNINGEILHYDLYEYSSLKFYPQYGDFVNNIKLNLGTDCLAFTSLQSMVMTNKINFGGETKQYILTFWKVDDVAGVCITYDENYNLLGYINITNTGHANDATIANGNVYIARNDNVIGYCPVTELIDPSNFGSTKTLSTIELNFEEIYGIDYDPITKTFCINHGTHLCITDENFAILHTYDNIVSDFVNIVGGNKIIVQGLSYRNGICYIVWMNATYSEFLGNTIVGVVDPFGNKIIKVNNVSTRNKYDEPEGCCIDPISGLIYLPHLTYISTEQAFTISALKASMLDDNNLASNDSILSKVHSDGSSFTSRFLHTAWYSCYVDNTFKGRSNGTHEYPFKTIGEAIVLCDANTDALSIVLINSGVPYKGNIFVCNVPVYFNTTAGAGGNGKVEVNGIFHFYHSDSDIRNLIFNPTSDVIGTTTCILHAEYSKVHITNCVFLMNTLVDGSIMQNQAGIKVDYSDLYVDMCTFERTETTKTGGVDVNMGAFAILSWNKSNTYVRTYNTFKNVNMFSNQTFSKVKYSQESNNTIDNCTFHYSLVDIRHWIYSIEFTPCNTYEQIKDVVDIAEKGSSRVATVSLNYSLSSPNIPAGVYTIDLRELRPTGNGKPIFYHIAASENDVNSQYAGSVNQLPQNSDNVRRVNYYQTYDETHNNRTLIYKGDWCDSLGRPYNKAYSSDGINLIKNSHLWRLANQRDLSVWGPTASSNNITVETVNADYPFLKGLKEAIHLTSQTGKIGDISCAVEVSLGDSYCLSLWAKGNGVVYLQFGNSEWKQIAFNINSEEYTLYYLACTINSSHIFDNNKTYVYVGVGSDSDVTVCAPKVERGYLPSIWKYDSFSGVSADRPTDAEIGQQYFDTSISPARPIFYAGNGNWVDSSGDIV